MTFGPNHYVPVLKVKRGEKKALQLIPPDLRGGITPLLEIVERNEGKSIEEHLNTAFRDLANSIHPYSRCFLDAREVEGDSLDAADQVFRMASSQAIVFTPVTGISRSSSDVVAAMNYRAYGIALRLTRKEFEDGQLARLVRTFLTRYGLVAEEIDLIVDLGPLDNFVEEGVLAFAKVFLDEVPDQARWRTFTISACAFPLSMGVIDRNSYGLIERSEWKAWRDGLFVNRRKLPRLPAFSDCAIQHPVGVEGFDPRIMQVSASVRYTYGDHWLLIKGESTRAKLASVQFPALAAELVYGSLLRSYFKSAGHCTGCGMIQAAARGAAGLGSAEAWRRIGTIHHITTVAHDLAALPWP